MIIIIIIISFITTAGLTLISFALNMLCNLFPKEAIFIKDISINTAQYC